MSKLTTTLASLARTIASAYRYTKIVRCPVFHQPAEILVDAPPGSPLKSKKKAISIRDCSLWPKGKSCSWTCLKIK